MEQVKQVVALKVVRITMPVQTALIMGEQMVLCVIRPEEVIRRETVLSRHRLRANSYQMHFTCKEVKSLNWGEY